MCACLLYIGKKWGGIALGLLSGLGLGLLTFFKYVHPTSPPYELLIVQAAWCILTTTLEASGFFHVIAHSFKNLATLSPPRVVICLASIGLTLLTGNKKWYDIDRESKSKPSSYLLRFIIALSTHVAALISPLSVTGLLLYLMIGNHQLLPTCHFMSKVGYISIASTLILTTLCCFLPALWFSTQTKALCNPYETDPVNMGQRIRYIGVYVLLLLMGGILSTAQSSSNTHILLGGKLFPIKLSLFFALTLLSTAAIIHLCFNLKPAKMLLTHQFKIGISQFFNFLGFYWLIDTFVNHDRALITNLLYKITACTTCSWVHYMMLYLMYYTIIYVSPCFLSFSGKKSKALLVMLSLIGCFWGSNDDFFTCCFYFFLFLLLIEAMPIAICLVVPLLVPCCTTLWSLIIGLIFTLTLKGAMLWYKHIHSI